MKLPEEPQLFTSVSSDGICTRSITIFRDPVCVCFPQKVHYLTQEVEPGKTCPDCGFPCVVRVAPLLTLRSR